MLIGDDPPWHAGLALPPADNLRRIGVSTGRAEPFLDTGTAIQIALARIIARHCPWLDPEARTQDPARRVLDFGCGVGRVALPMRHRLGLPSHACDVDASATDWLAGALPGVEVRTTPFHPPLPYPRDGFDLVYSVSIWTHLSGEMQGPWLEEIARILRPGGLALLTTAGFAVLRGRERRSGATPFAMTATDLRREGFLYLEAPEIEGAVGRSPEITGSYGRAMHDPAWIRTHWSEVFEIVEQVEGGYLLAQDVNVLRKPG